MKLSSVQSHIPSLKPSQFDDYLFGNWKPEVAQLYDQFHIEKVEYYKPHLKLPLQPHRRLVYFFIYLTKGKAIRSKGLTQYVLEPHHLFALPADQITSLEYISEDAEGFYCHFLPEIFNQSLTPTDFITDLPFFQFTGNPIVQVTDDKAVVALLELLWEEYKKNQPERISLLKMYLLSIFVELSLQVNPQGMKPQNAATQLTQRYKDALSSFIYEKKTVQEYADYLAVSPNHLHKSVKATTGKSAHELLEEMRILEAKVMLKQTSMSIGEIAFKLGKLDPSDFCRFFKSKTQMTPNRFRKNEN